MNIKQEWPTLQDAYQDFAESDFIFLHAEDVAVEVWDRVMDQPVDEFVGSQGTTLASSQERKPTVHPIYTGPTNKQGL